MNFFKRIAQRCRRKKIMNFCVKLGHQVGWSIESTEVQKLYELDLDQMIDELELKIFDMKEQFVYLVDTFDKQCAKRNIYPSPGCEFTLLRTETGCRIRITRNYGHGNISEFVLLYHGIGWTISKEDDKVVFNCELFDKLNERLAKTKTDVSDRTSFVRQLNWLACTMNDIDERIKNWEVKKEETNG